MRPKIMSVVLVSIMIFTTAILGNLGVTATIQNQATAQQKEGQYFNARLDGSAQVPPVQTTASGFADIDILPGGNTLAFDIYVNNIEGVTQAHIHQGNSSEAGPVIAPFFNASTPTGLVNGELTDGSITSADLMGPLQGRQLSDLITLMQNGTAYVNVHTVQNPDGEIRGTIEVEVD